MAQASLGNDSTIDFGLVDGDGGAQLRLDLEWKRSYGVSRPVSLDLGDGQEVVGAERRRRAEHRRQRHRRACGLLLPLSTEAMSRTRSTNTLVDEEASEVDFDVAVAAENAHIGANLGPVSVDLGTGGRRPAASTPASASTATGATRDGPRRRSPTSSPGLLRRRRQRRGLRGRRRRSSAPSSRSSSVGTSVRGGDLTVDHASSATVDDLADVFGGTSTTVVAPPERPPGAPRGQALRVRLRCPTASSSTSSTPRCRCAPPRTRRDARHRQGPAGRRRLHGRDPRRARRLHQGEGDIEQSSEAQDVPHARSWPRSSSIVLNGADRHPWSTSPATASSSRRPLPTVTTDARGAAPRARPRRTSTRWSRSSRTRRARRHDSAPSEAERRRDERGDPRRASDVQHGHLDEGRRRAPATRSSAPRRPAGAAEPSPSRCRTYVASRRHRGRHASTFKDHRRRAGGSTHAAAHQALPRFQGSSARDDASVTEIEGVTLSSCSARAIIGRHDGCVRRTRTPRRAVRRAASSPVDLGLPGLSLKTGECGLGQPARSAGRSTSRSGMSRTRGLLHRHRQGQDEFEVGAHLEARPAVDGTRPHGAARDHRRRRGQERDRHPRVRRPLRHRHQGQPTDDDTTSSSREIARAQGVRGDRGQRQRQGRHQLAPRGRPRTRPCPGVATDFSSTWAWGASTGRPRPARARQAGDAKNRSRSQFNNVTLDAGEFFGEALKPYLEQVVDATKPLQPVIDTIFTPMPVISDLSKAAGGKAVTIASLAETFNTLPQGRRSSRSSTRSRPSRHLTGVDSATRARAAASGSAASSCSATRVATTSAVRGHRHDDRSTPTADRAARRDTPGETTAKDGHVRQPATAAKVSKAAALKAGP